MGARTRRAQSFEVRISGGRRRFLARPIVLKPMRYALASPWLRLMSLVFQLRGTPERRGGRAVAGAGRRRRDEEPLEGVVVLAWWTRHVRSSRPSEEYRDSQGSPDRQGRPLHPIESRWFFSLNRWCLTRAVFSAMFKSGHGDSMPGYAGSESWPKEKREALQNAAAVQLVRHRAGDAGVAQRRAARRNT